MTITNSPSMIDMTSPKSATALKIVEAFAAAANCPVSLPDQPVYFVAPCSGCKGFEVLAAKSADHLIRFYRVTVSR
jgi:hypothetical protein